MDDARDLTGADGFADPNRGLEDAGKGSVGEGVATLDPHEAQGPRRLGLGPGQDAENGGYRGVRWARRSDET